jgi:hypothetical protein
MPKNQHSKFIKQMLLDSLFYLLKGGLRIKNGHLPQANHHIPNDFFGVCVASNADSATDAYIIGQLETLGINNVRLDFSYDDLNNFNERFLQKLIAEDYNVTLHLLAPFDAAKNMLDSNEQERWRMFLATVLDQYGTSIQQVEIGNTINRKRWAGYSYDGFLIAWEIAYVEIKSRNIKLLGPNVQDFEPIYNIGILKILQSKNLRPDTHTDNLFVERVFEPERFDHRILKYKWAKLLKYNLVKKARTLQKIGLDFDVPHTSSSAAFWAIYRIKRILIAGEQKQADYLTRYFTLLAASGALRQANWGALICNREGLINDGLTDAEYPMLERIAQYQSADGLLNEYERYPSFYAMQTVAHYLSGAHYYSAIASTNGLEIHHFSKAQLQFHIAWTTNGKVAYLADIYSERSLRYAKIFNRDGSQLDKNIELVCETPIYLCWDADFNIEVLPKPKLSKNLVIHTHIEQLRYFRYNQDGWLGLVLAKDAIEADLLMQALNPIKLNAPNKKQSLRHARNVIWATEDPRNSAAQITIKQPVNMYPHKALLDRLKPSKAKRSWNGAMELLRRGIGTAQPIAYFEKVGDKSLKQNFYICERVEADCSIGEIFSALARGEATYRDLTPEIIYSQFAQFCNKMHSRLVYFRDFSGGNILVNIDDNKQLHFSLIDTARLRTLNVTPFPLSYRLADMVRACHKLHPEGRERLMQIYLGLSGRKFNLHAKYKFYLYDLKVKLKRTIGRKGIKRLIKRLKSIQ